MKEFYFFIIDFKEIHPIRFWMVVVGIIILLAATIYLLNRWLSLSKQVKTNNQMNDTEYKAKSGNEKELEIGIKSAPASKSNRPKLLIGIITAQMIVIIFLVGTVFFYEKSTNDFSENTSVSSSRNVFGIDVSQYQGKIEWSEVRTSHHPIEFVFIRATMGVDGIDRYFKRNWNGAKEQDYICGAYHYYRPNENAVNQFENFKSMVRLQKGDFVPVLDIEKESKFGTEKLREGVLIWLKLAEEEYGKKPIVYTGLNFYQKILKGHIDGYPLWIAAYSGKKKLNGVDWTFHQFTEKVIVKGIKSTVDGNDFKGDISELDALRMLNTQPQ